MRYAGQDDTVNVRIPYQPVSERLAPFLVSEFENRYKRLYGRTVPQAETQVVTWRLTGQTSSEIRRFSWASPHYGDSQTARKRPIYLSTESHHSEVPVFDRYGLKPGSNLQGPLVIEEKESTLVVTVSAKVQVLPDFNILVELES
jgi:N-methylhydantoinase A